MALRNAITLASFVLAAGVAAQSADPGLGVNSHAQGATEEVTPGAGPNGSEDWLNTGINDGGWNPPFMALDDLILVDLQTYYSGVGQACQQYDQYFQSAGKQYNVSPVILAIIAMQESSCNANAGGPTPGLMQVSCDNYPNGVCTDSIQDNVDAGTNYLVSQINSSNGNAVQAFGSYNGWFTAGNGLNNNKGLTADYPCSSEGQSNGEPQNLDYIQQIFNGWMLGLDVYGDDSWIGTYKCAGSCNGNNQC
ncbi:transglycosylase SLT domain protein [Talaromyces proteolyticus]|uniref:Transglycosylase SLT domain protein n=1 Tax=Talaromyces proteolyticus TaxID=1131652 RepID=A0AAD4KNT0_9EURO|nr:transglycosylase SLT domain protein [Talaromyces proteolyticus]KAH8696114.1 transglycosylase SLT domain protein [Talaromyces proteolyticus]